MQSLPIRAVATSGFRIQLDLSAWPALGIDLGSAIIRLQAWKSLGGSASAPDLEIATNAANPVTFDPATGLAIFSAPATATAQLSKTYSYAVRAEFSGYELPMFGGSINFQDGVFKNAPSATLPAFDTAWVAAHPFGPAPVPAPLSAAVDATLAARDAAIVRAIIFAG